MFFFGSFIGKILEALECFAWAALFFFTECVLSLRLNYFFQVYLFFIITFLIFNLNQ